MASRRMPDRLRRHNQSPRWLRAHSSWFPMLLGTMALVPLVASTIGLPTSSASDIDDDSSSLLPHASAIPSDASDDEERHRRQAVLAGPSPLPPISVPYILVPLPPPEHTADRPNPARSASIPRRTVLSAATRQIAASTAPAVSQPSSPA